MSGEIASNLASPLFFRRERACLFATFFELITREQHKISTFSITDPHWYLPSHLWNGFWLKPAKYFRESIRRKLHAAGFLNDEGFLLANLTGTLEVRNIAVGLELRGIMSESKLKLVRALPGRIRERIHIEETDILPSQIKQYQLCRWMMPMRVQEVIRYDDGAINPISLWKHRRFCEAIFLLWLGNNRFEDTLFSDGLEIHSGKFRVTDAYALP